MAIAKGQRKLHLLIELLFSMCPLSTFWLPLFLPDIVKDPSGCRIYLLNDGRHCFPVNSLFLKKIYTKDLICA